MRRIIATAILALLLAFPAAADHKKPLHDWRNASQLMLNVGRDLVCFWTCSAQRHGKRRHYDVTLGNTYCLQLPKDDVESVENTRRDMGAVTR